MTSPLDVVALIVISTASLISNELGTTSTIKASGSTAYTVFVINHVANKPIANILTTRALRENFII